MKASTHLQLYCVLPCCSGGSCSAASQAFSMCAPSRGRARCSSSAAWWQQPFWRPLQPWLLPPHPRSTPAGNCLHLQHSRAALPLPQRIWPHLQQGLLHMRPPPFTSLPHFERMSADEMPGDAVRAYCSRQSWSREEHASRQSNSRAILTVLKLSLVVEVSPLA